MIAWFAVVILVIACILITRDDPTLTEVKRRYAVLRKNLPEGMEELSDKTVITGFRKKYGEIGDNVNKGQEIGLCIDGKPNEVFHVLIHELAHTVTRSYVHNQKFWENYHKLRDHCVKLGIYQKLKKNTDFCGKYIRD